MLAERISLEAICRVMEIKAHQLYIYMDELYDVEIKKKKAKTIFYATWTAKATPDEQPRLTEACQTIGNEPGSLVAPVGEAWKLALTDTLALHGPDGKHPNLAGSYLADCGLYQVITRQKAAGLPLSIIRSGKPANNLSETMAEKLQQVAEKTPIDY